MISAVVLAKNEEANIKECLAGLKWFDDLLVIDDNSTDGTAKLAKNCGAKVVKHSLNNDFAKQRNFALRQVYPEPLDFARDKLRQSAQGDWVFFVDSDERVSEDLANEIKEKVMSQDVDGFYFKRIDNFMGRWLRYGEIGSLRILRLGRKKSGEWEGKVDEIWEVKGKTQTLKNPLLHFSHRTLGEFLVSINERSTLNAEQFYLEGKRTTFFEWFKPLAKFFQNYFFRLGFLDGVPGFVFAVLMSFHSFLVRGKLYLLWERVQKEPPSSRCPSGLRRANKKGKLFFGVWAIFVFISYLYFLYKKGLSKW